MVATGFEQRDGTEIEAARQAVQPAARASKPTVGGSRSLSDLVKNPAAPPSSAAQVAAPAEDRVTSSDVPDFLKRLKRGKR